MAPGADEALDIGFHEDLQDGFGHAAQEVALSTLLQQGGKWHAVIGHRGLSGWNPVGKHDLTPEMPDGHRRDPARRARQGSARQIAPSKFPPHPWTLTPANPQSRDRSTILRRIK